MPNMSYCRFRNTQKDFAECVETIEAIVAGEAEPLEREEYAAMLQLLEDAANLVQALAEHAGEDVEVGVVVGNRRALDAMLSGMMKARA